MNELKIAAGYIRESTDDQLEYSPEAQRKALRQYAEKNCLVLDERYIYCDEGISGRKAGKRPAFQAMIATAKSKDCPFDTILVWKFSRFARNQEESIVYKSMLKRDGIDVVSITEPLADGPFGTLIERIIEWMDEYYSIRLAEEVKKGMTEKARRGGLQSTPPFGYCVKNNMLVPNTEEAALVAEIFDRFNSGDGLYDIARNFNERGIKTHRGNAFENRTVEYVLRNPAYIGKLRWNPSGRTRRDFKNENIILADAEHDCVVEKSVWDAAQKRLDEIKLKWGYNARPTYELKDWPSGLVRCAECGATLIFTRPCYYKCNNYARGACGTSQHIRADILKDAIIERLNIDANSRFSLNAKIVYKEERGDTVTVLESRIESLEKKKLRLKEAFLNGADSVEEYKAWKKSIDADISLMQQRLEAEKNTATDTDIRTALHNSIADALETLTSSLSSVSDKNNAARSIIESCTFDKANNLLSITYRVLF